MAAVTTMCSEQPPTAPEQTSSSPDVLAALFGPVTFIGAGDIADCGSFQGDERTADLLDSLPGQLFTAGDNAYPDGSDSDYTNCYDPTWGRHKARTWPAVGNHEYYLGNADGSWNYWGSQIGDSGKYYYSHDLGAWHIVVLNSEKAYVPISLGSVQEQWLQNDLAATDKKCILAIWHEPRFYSSTSTGSSGFRPYLGQAWTDLYNAGAAIVVNGHSHAYERFAPQDPDGNLDTLRGIREFIIGTGGEKTYLPDGTIKPNSEVRGAANGVMKFTLYDGSYDWEFIPVAGATFTDSGSGLCPAAVNVVPVASVAVSPSTATIEVGGTQQLTATPLDANGNPLTGRTVTWASDAPGVATVDANGLVSGGAAGSATITATSEGQTGSAAITVTLVPVASVAVSPSMPTIVIGGTQQLTATPLDANGNLLAGRTVTWTSSNTDVATVSETGLVTGLRQGAATITATVDGTTGSSQVKVRRP